MDFNIVHHQTSTWHQENDKEKKEEERKLRFLNITPKTSCVYIAHVWLYQKNLAIKMVDII